MSPKALFCAKEKRSAPNLGHKVCQAAEGETVPTIVRAVRRVDIRRIEVEVVRSSCSSISINSGCRRPAVAVDACVPQAAVVDIDVPAAHKVSGI